MCAEEDVGPPSYGQARTDPASASDASVHRCAITDDTPRPRSSATPAGAAVKRAGTVCTYALGAPAIRPSPRAPGRCGTGEPAITHVSRPAHRPVHHRWLRDPCEKRAARSPGYPPIRLPARPVLRQARPLRDARHVALGGPVPCPRGLLARRAQRPVLTQSHDLEPRRSQPEPDQLLLHRIRPPHAQREVVFGRTTCVR